MSLDLDAPLLVSASAAHGTLTVTASGELTVRTAWELRQAATDATADRPVHSLVIDLWSVTDLDPAGLVAVSASTMAMRRRGCAVTVVLPRSERALRVIDLAGIGSLLSNPR